MPRRFTRIDTFRLLWIFCFRNQYSISLSPWDGMCRQGSVCADGAGWSGSTHYAEGIMLVFSPDVSYTKKWKISISLIIINYYFLSQHFQKTSASEASESVYMRERVKPKTVIATLLLGTFEPWKTNNKNILRMSTDPDKSAHLCRLSFIYM